MGGVFATQPYSQGNADFRWVFGWCGVGGERWRGETRREETATGRQIAGLQWLWGLRMCGRSVGGAIARQPWLCLATRHPDRPALHC